MNYKTGFFRIWLIISIVWLFMCLFLFQGVIYPSVYVRGFSLEIPIGTTISDAQNIIKFFIINERNKSKKKEEDGEADFSKPFDNGKDVDLWASEIVQEYVPKQIKNSIIGLLETFFGLPIFLFIIGISFNWIIVGFRKK